MGHQGKAVTFAFQHSSPGRPLTRISSLQKEKSPLTHITAHMGKINALDWSYMTENEILTAGQDAQVKVILEDGVADLETVIEATLAYPDLGHQQPPKGKIISSSWSAAFHCELHGMSTFLFRC